MRITGSYGWPDGSSVDVIVDDDLDDEYNPIRTSELAGLTLDLLRRAVTDRDHTQAEHDRPEP